MFVCCFLFFFILLGRLPPSSFITGSVLTSLLSLDPSIVELFHLFRSSPFHVSCGFFLFWLLLSLFFPFPPVLFCLGRLRAPFFCWDFFVWVFLFCFFVFLARSSSTQLFPYWFCSHQFAELGSIHCWAFSPRDCSLAFLSFAILFLAICRAVSWYTDLFFPGFCLGLSLFSDSVDFSYSKGSIFKFFWGIFYGSSFTALFFFLVLFFSASENA